MKGISTNAWKEFRHNDANGQELHEKILQVYPQMFAQNANAMRGS